MIKIYIFYIKHQPLIDCLIDFIDKCFLDDCIWFFHFIL